MKAAEESTVCSLRLINNDNIIIIEKQGLGLKMGFLSAGCILESY